MMEYALFTSLKGTASLLVVKEKEEENYYAIIIINIMKAHYCDVDKFAFPQI